MVRTSGSVVGFVQSVVAGTVPQDAPSSCVREHVQGIRGKRSCFVDIFISEEYNADDNTGFYAEVDFDE